MTRIDVEPLRQRVSDAIHQNRARILDVAERIRIRPELKFEEFFASDLLAKELGEFGFEVIKPYCELETAFLATRAGNGPGATVAIVAEYDALAGLGHGCAHNLIAAAGLASGIGLAAVVEEIPGRVAVMGTPAEEGGFGKVLMIERGAFADVDAALQIHHSANRTGAPTEWPEGTCAAIVMVEFEFFGRAAHAGFNPWDGINALNAVISLFNGVGVLREHIRSGARIHGIITQGGDAVNVVPERAAARFFVRADSRAYMDELVERLRDVGQGAALMTGCRVEISDGQQMYDMRPSYVIGEVFNQHMQSAGLEVSTGQVGRQMYGTDFGNVSHEIPAVTGNIAISHDAIGGHNQQVVEAAGSDFAQEQLMKVSVAMAWTALDLLVDPSLVQGAHDEHEAWQD